jgi:hypothetical protein
MPNISIVAIIDKLSEHVDEQDAEELLGLALDHLDWPVKEEYTPSEVVAIGTVIADAHRQQLRESDNPDAQALERVFGPFIDGLKADQLELQPNGAFVED